MTTAREKALKLKLAQTIAERQKARADVVALRMTLAAISATLRAGAPEATKRVTELAAMALENTVQDP